MPNEQDYLKNISLQNISDLSKIAFKSGNFILLEDIDTAYPKVFDKDSQFFKQYNPTLDVCESGNPQTFEFLKQKNVNTQVKDENGNTCLHYAAKFGNIKLIKHLAKTKYYDFNAVNEKKETPLHYGLKEGVHKYVKTALELSAHTDMTRRDIENLQPHNIKLKRVPDGFRLGGYLKKMFEQQYNQKLAT